jgi:hypothetical protein
MPYLDEDNTDPTKTAEEDPGHTFTTASWTESFEVPKGLFTQQAQIENGQGGGSTLDSGAGNGDSQMVQLETEGKWAYVPIMTHIETRDHDGKEIGVHKGFSLPLMAKRASEVRNVNDEL